AALEAQTASGRGRGTAAEARRGLGRGCQRILSPNPLTASPAGTSETAVWRERAMAAGRGGVGEGQSEALAEHPPGGRRVRRVPVYLPPSYDRQPERRFPVVYVLVGLFGRGISLLNFNAFVPTLPERMDTLLNRGEVGELILVMPDGFTRY